MELDSLLREKLIENGWNLTEDGLNALSENGNITDITALTNKAIDLDLRGISLGTLPDDINKSKYENIPGNIVLQIQKIKNLSSPKGSEVNTGVPHLLKLILTDGVQTVQAIEMDNIPNIHVNTYPGSKIYLTSKTIDVSHCFLLLTSSNTQFLGGKVESLIEKWELNRSLAKHTRGGIEEGGPPPWIPFGEKIMKQSVSEKNFKSLDLAKNKDSSENSEFEAQRKGAILEATKIGSTKVFGGGNNKLLDYNVQKIIDAGFTIEEAEYTLRICRNNLDRALRNLQAKHNKHNKDENGKSNTKSGGAEEKKGGKGRNKHKDEDAGQALKPSGKVSLFEFLEDKLPHTEPPPMEIKINNEKKTTNNTFKGNNRVIAKPHFERGKAPGEEIVKPHFERGKPPGEEITKPNFERGKAPGEEIVKPHFERGKVQGEDVGKTHYERGKVQGEDVGKTHYERGKVQGEDVGKPNFERGKVQGEDVGKPHFERGKEDKRLSVDRQEVKSHSKKNYDMQRQYGKYDQMERQVRSDRPYSEKKIEFGRFENKRHFESNHRSDKGFGSFKYNKYEQKNGNLDYNSKNEFFKNKSNDKGRSHNTTSQSAIKNYNRSFDVSDYKKQLGFVPMSEKPPRFQKYQNQQNENTMTNIQNWNEQNYNRIPQSNYQSSLQNSLANLTLQQNLVNFQDQNPQEPYADILPGVSTANTKQSNVFYQNVVMPTSQTGDTRAYGNRANQPPAAPQSHLNTYPNRNTTGYVQEVKSSNFSAIPNLQEVAFKSNAPVLHGYNDFQSVFAQAARGPSNNFAANPQFVTGQNGIAPPAHKPWVWKKGDKCMARYWEDQMFYNAVVTAVSENTCVVKFTDYGNYEEVLQDHCYPITEES